MVDNIKRFEMGDGFKHALIWISIISSFGVGWYTRGQVVDGELSQSALVSLQSDIVAKSDNRKLTTLAIDRLEKGREGRVYDENCSNMSLSDFTK